MFCAAPPNLRRLIQEDVSGFDLSALKLTVSAGESVNPEIVDAWEPADRRAPARRLWPDRNPDDRVELPRDAPQARLHGPAAARRGDGYLWRRRADRRRRREGQLAIALPNPQVMLHYWNDPERTASQQVDVDGQEWFLTGDNVRQDEDGYIFFEGRADDIITSSGYRIGPQEVENALIEHPAVQESAAVGMPDPERGEIVKAFIVLTDPALASEALCTELQDHVKRTTAPYKYPRAIEFIAELPKTVSGKIRRNVLRSHDNGSSDHH